MRLASGLLILLLLFGCRSHVIVINIHNMTDAPLKNIEVTYPGGSYGLGTLAPSANHESRIKPLRTGAVEFTYIDGKGVARKNSWKAVNKNDRGRIDVHIEPERVHIAANLQ
jgi:hypothetical protein